MHAIILAGGKGTRLKPYTNTIPKPLVPIAEGVPILEVVIQQLARCGFSHITIALNHMARFIMAFFGDGAKYKIIIDYSIEDKPLSTIGPLTLIDNLEENFLVMNGDILCNLDYRKLYEYHVKKNNDVTVAVYRRQSKIDFGVLTYDRDNTITAFREKPLYTFDVSMGIFCVNRRIVEQLPRGKKYGFDELMVDGIKKKQKLRARPFNGFWLDIGRPEDYEYVCENYKAIKDKLRCLR